MAHCCQERKAGGFSGVPQFAPRLGTMVGDLETHVIGSRHPSNRRPSVKPEPKTHAAVPCNRPFQEGKRYEHNLAHGRRPPRL